MLVVERGGGVRGRPLWNTDCGGGGGGGSGGGDTWLERKRERLTDR